jgi:hypothetical protein
LSSKSFGSNPPQSNPKNEYKNPPLPHQLLGIYLWVDVSYNGSKTTRVPIPKVHISGKNIKSQC